MADAKSETVKAPEKPAEVRQEEAQNIENASSALKAVSVNGEMSPEERKALLEEIRLRMSMRTLDVKAPKGWVCRWARKNDEQDLIRLEYRGYRVVRETPGQPRRYTTAVPCSGEGTYIVGDVILVETPLEVWEFHRAEERKRSQMMQSDATSKFIEDTLASGVPVFERDENKKVVGRRDPNDMKGIRTRTISTKNL